MKTHCLPVPALEPRTRRYGLGACLLLIFLTLGGCATGPNANPRDPFEPFNRGVYEFNDAVDAAFVRPVATAYRKVTPPRVRQGIGNVFDNLQDVWSIVNNALQLKGQAALDSMARVGVNTIFGWGGIFDIASEMSIERHTKDFGHTLGYWGVAPGPYLVLPLLGPSTLRDAVALPIDMNGDIVANIAHIPTRNTAIVVRGVNDRERLLKVGTMLEQASLDKYSFYRDAHLQRRLNAIHDGNPPDEEAFFEVEPAPQDIALSQAEPSLQPAGDGNEKEKP